MKREIYGDKIPLLLRMIFCLGIQDGSYRFRWGEFSLGWALGLSYKIYHDTACFRISPFIFSLYINMPVLITFRDGTEDWNASYGFSVFLRDMHVHWRDKCKVIYFPWNWKHVRHSFLWPDGSLHHHAGKNEYTGPDEAKQRYRYTYTLKNGTVQERTATICGDEREWRWRWYTWSPWPRKISRCIDIAFSDEVGERTGSWKGGCIGCGYEWRKGETMLECLRRMESERKF